LFITRQKLSNAHKSLKSKKKFTGINQLSERASAILHIISTTNSRVKTDLPLKLKAGETQETKLTTEMADSG